MLEIKNGGYPQIDLFNRLLINNIHRLQRNLSDRLNDTSNNRSDKSTDINNEQMNVSHTTVTSPRIVVDSFFPFTSNTGNSAELSDILITNGGLLADGSIYDAASITLQGVE